MCLCSFGRSLHNTTDPQLSLCLFPGFVRPHTEVFFHHQSSCVGIMSHIEELYLCSCLSELTVVDSCFCDLDLFSPRQWKYCLKVEAQSRGLQGNGLSSYRTEHSCHIIPFLLATLMHSSWVFDEFTTTHCFLVCVQHQLDSSRLHNSLWTEAQCCQSGKRDAGGSLSSVLLCFIRG